MPRIRLKAISTEVGDLLLQQAALAASRQEIYKRLQNLARCRALLAVQPVVEVAIPSVTQEDWRARLMRLIGRDPTVWPVCGRGHLRLVEELPAVPFDPPGRSPP